MFLISVLLLPILFVFSKNLENNNKINKKIYSNIILKNVISHLKAMEDYEIKKYICFEKKFSNSNNLLEYLNFKIQMPNLNEEYTLSLIDDEGYLKIKINEIEDIYVY